MNKEIKTSFLKLFFGIICCFIVINCAWAAGVPKYNPSDPNPKPGLYRVGDMNYARGSFVISRLSDDKILITGHTKLRNAKHNKTAEILDLNTGKFKAISDTNYFSYRSFVLSDGRILLLGGITPVYASKNCLEIFDPKTNKFIDTKICKIDEYSFDGNAMMYEINNDTYALYIRDYDKPYTINSRLHPKFLMYVYDAKTNTITDEPIRQGQDKYIEYQTLENKKSGRYFDSSSVECKTMRKIAKEKIGSFNYLKLNDEKVLIFARNLVDYGVRVDSIENGKYKDKKSWFSPMYEYNINNQTLTPINEYVRATYHFAMRLKNKNALMLYGGAIPFGNYNPQADPAKIPYEMRIKKTDRDTDSKYVYVYVYE